MNPTISVLRPRQHALRHVLIISCARYACQECQVRMELNAYGIVLSIHAVICEKNVKQTPLVATGKHGDLAAVVFERGHVIRTPIFFLFQ